MDCRQLLGLIVLTVLLTSLPVSATEKILSYDSVIDIAADASMTVSETIRVVAEGQQIRRGIYREFPTTYNDRYGNRVVVDFKVLSVTRDGAREAWHSERRANGVRIYAGHPDMVVSPGEHSYTFTYRTDRQIGFFEHRDELYWNVTGNGWGFSIEHASAVVRLPAPVSDSDITIAGYTGAQGSRQGDYTSTVGRGSATIQASRELPPGSGLTLVMDWPKGVVTAPGRWQQLGYLLADNLGLLLSLLAFGGSALYLLLMWSRHGRDPGKGVIFPHYEPPAGCSPAAARYVSNMGYDNKTFTAFIINLAVQGCLSITGDDGDFVLQRKPGPAGLVPAEAALLDKLFRHGAVLKLENSNHSQVSATRAAHKQLLRRGYLNQYFKTNGRLMLPSIVASALLLLVIVSTGRFVALVLAIYVGIAVMHLLFAYLLKAPSALGRRLMDQLEGFKLYLEVAEKDDLARRHPPDLTPELFERYLPYAIALGVEQEWAQRFSRVFSSLQAAPGGAYHPAWYQGDFNAGRMNSFASTVGSKLSSAISSASSPPGSSSGGGGGSSGGGGGGGGGGGW